MTIYIDILIAVFQSTSQTVKYMTELAGFRLILILMFLQQDLTENY